MSQIINLAESDIPMNYSNVLNSKEYVWQPSDTEDFYIVLTIAISDFLKRKKSKSETVGLSISDTDGSFKLGAIVGYEPPTEEDPSGNWSYAFTFNKEDMKQCTKIYDHSDAAFQTIFNHDAYQEKRMKFDNGEIVYEILIDAANCLYLFLDQNAQESSEVTLVLDGYFEARVTVEDGVKVMSLTPDGAMKTLVKGDKEAEV